MKYRLIGLTVWCATGVAVTLSAGQNSTPPVVEHFSAIAPLLDQIRHGADSTLVLHLGPANFEILKDVATPITSNEARAARAELRKVKPGLPEIRFTKNHEIAVYNLDDQTTIEVEVDATPEKWIRRTFEKIASYPNSVWQHFVEFGLRNGLTGLTVCEKGTARVGEITFSAVGPTACRYPGGLLHFSPTFYEDMRMSPDYPESTGTNGFVVLIHDPRQDVGGRFRLMSGLAALSAANSNVSFQYLVEDASLEKPVGTDPSAPVGIEGRPIRDGGLGVYLRRFSEPQRRVIVNSMLQRFLVDTPLAFQLVRSPEPQVHGLAIDDDRFLSESKVLFVESSKIQAALKALAEFAAPKDHANMDSEETAARGMVLEGVYMTAALQRADLTNSNDTQLIKHLERLKAGFGALGEVSSEIAKSSPEMLAHADALEKESAAYSAQLEECKNALKRHESMLPFIETAGRNSTKKVPLLFIGSYQTERLTRQLRADGIAYIVVEPRTRAPYSHFDVDQVRFEELVHDPNAYFTLAQREKVPCSLTEEQVRTIHIPFIDTILSKSITRLNDIMSLTDAGNINLNRLQLAVASNGWLVHSIVEIGDEHVSGVDRPGIGGSANTGRLGSGGGARPAEMPRGAFAFLDQGDRKTRLVLLDKDDERWRGEDRYARIVDAMFAVPYADKNQTPIILFATHPGGNSSTREYFSIYKRDSKRVYLVEGSNSSVASVLSLSAVRGRGSVDVDVQLGKLLKGGEAVDFRTDRGSSGSMGN